MLRSMADNSDTIIFIHGAALAGWMWRLQIEGVSDTFHCLVPDLPEHGQSSGDYTLVAATDAIADLIRNRAHEGKAHLVGLSLGGLISITVVDRYPELVKKVIVSAPPSGPIPGTAILMFTMRFMMPIVQSDFAIRRTATQLGLPEQDYQQFRQSQKSMTRNLLMTVAQETHAHRLHQSLQNATTPMLAVVGEKELGVNHRVVRDLTALMPNIQGRIAPQVGHGWNGENPKLFNQMIRDWFLHDTIPTELMPLPQNNS